MREGCRAHFKLKGNKKPSKAQHSCKNCSCGNQSDLPWPAIFGACHFNRKPSEAGDLQVNPSGTSTWFKSEKHPKKLAKHQKGNMSRFSLATKISRGKTRCETLGVFFPHGGLYRCLHVLNLLLTWIYHPHPQGFPVANSHRFNLGIPTRSWPKNDDSSRHPGAFASWVGGKYSNLRLMVQKSHSQPPGMVKKP